MYRVEVTFKFGVEDVITRYCTMYARSINGARLLTEALIEMSADDAFLAYFGDEYDPSAPASKYVTLYDEDDEELYI